MSIGASALRTWGEAQTVRYLGELKAWCRRLVGRSYGRPLLPRYPPRPLSCGGGKRVVFLRREPAGILVFRILHERMLAERHPFYDGE